MKRALTRGAVLLAMALPGLPEATDAQESPTWTDRPDAHAPVGVTLDHLRAPGELLLGYRLLHLDHSGTRVGADTVPHAHLLMDWEMMPLSMSRQIHAVEASFGVSEHFTLQGSVPFVVTDAEMRTQEFLEHSGTSGVGDVELHALASFYDSWPYRAHASAGVSLPVGSIRQRDVTPLSFPDPELLPYPMQHGSGTLDLLPALTFVTENVHGTVGGQARAVIRTGENDREYRLGHRVEATGWGAYRFSDFVSGSVRVNWERWGNVRGSDPALDPGAVPMAHPFLQSGSRIDLPVGVNVYLREGRLEGGRLSAELQVPVHHDLDGPQLGRDWGVGLSWTMPFGQSAAAPEHPPARQPAPPPPDRSGPEPPAGELLTLCLATGRNEQVLVTPQGDSLLADPGTLSIRAEGASSPLPGTYADGRAWFAQDDPMEFDGHDYVKFGSESALDCDEIVQVGVYDDVPFFADVHASEPLDILYVPVQPGLWQVYRVRPAVRG